MSFNISRSGSQKIMVSSCSAEIGQERFLDPLLLVPFPITISERWILRMKVTDKTEYNGPTVGELEI